MTPYRAAALAAGANAVGSKAFLGDLPPQNDRRRGQDRQRLSEPLIILVPVTGSGVTFTLGSPVTL